MSSRSVARKEHKKNLLKSSVHKRQKRKPAISEKAEKRYERPELKRQSILDEAKSKDEGADKKAEPEEKTDKADKKDS